MRKFAGFIAGFTLAFTFAFAGGRPRVTQDSVSASGVVADISGQTITPGTVKVDVLDAGVAYINGSMQVLGEAKFLSGIGACVNASSYFSLDCASNGAMIRSTASYMEIGGNGAIPASTQDLGAASFRWSKTYSNSLYITNLTDINTAPTLTGGCTSPTVTWNNGSALFQFDVGTTCAGITQITINLPTATNGWTCQCENVTAPTVRYVFPDAFTTSSVELKSFARVTGAQVSFTDGDDIRCMCRGG